MKSRSLIGAALLSMGLGASALFAPPAAAAGKPVVVLVNSEPVNLDPQYSSADANIMLSIHEGLFRLDNEGRIVPAVAGSIKAIDNLTWEIKIRPGLTFPNGEPTNAAPAVFPFD